MGPAVREIFLTDDAKDSGIYDEIKKKLTDYFPPLKKLDLKFILKY